MICYIGNRPALQVGRYQVIEYNTKWLGEALKRAAKDAGQEDFDYIDDLLSGVVEYLETRCSLKLLKIEELYERVRRMLMKIGCHAIAKELRLLAPPITLNLEVIARGLEGVGKKQRFFKELEEELKKLREVGVEEMHVMGVKESAIVLSGEGMWGAASERVMKDVEEFLSGFGVARKAEEKAEI